MSASAAHCGHEMPAPNPAGRVPMNYHVNSTASPLTAGYVPATPVLCTVNANCDLGKRHGYARLALDFSSRDSQVTGFLTVDVTDLSRLPTCTCAHDKDSPFLDVLSIERWLSGPKLKIQQHECTKAFHLGNWLLEAAPNGSPSTPVPLSTPYTLLGPPCCVHPISFLSRDLFLALSVYIVEPKCFFPHS